MKTGYRCGSIGAYTGQGEVIAWKVLDYEFNELGNDHLLLEVSKFLRMPATSWGKVIGEFKKRYGNSTGIWLSRTRKDASMYKEYGIPRPVQYREEDIVSDLGGDGIFVLDISQPNRPIGFYDFKGSKNFNPICEHCGKAIGIGEVGLELKDHTYYHPNHYGDKLTSIAHRKPLPTRYITGRRAVTRNKAESSLGGIK